MSYNCPNIHLNKFTDIKSPLINKFHSEKLNRAILALSAIAPFAINHRYNATKAIISNLFISDTRFGRWLIIFLRLLSIKLQGKNSFQFSHRCCGMSFVNFYGLLVAPRCNKLIIIPLSDMAFAFSYQAYVRGSQKENLLLWAKKKFWCKGFAASWIYGVGNTFKKFNWFLH